LPNKIKPICFLNGTEKLCYEALYAADRIFQFFWSVVLSCLLMEKDKSNSSKRYADNLMASGMRKRYDG
jgi:hypothetical protein